MLLIETALGLPARLGLYPHIPFLGIAGLETGGRAEMGSPRVPDPCQIVLVPFCGFEARVAQPRMRRAPQRLNLPLAQRVPALLLLGTLDGQPVDADPHQFGRGLLLAIPRARLRLEELPFPESFVNDADVTASFLGIGICLELPDGRKQWRRDRAHDVPLAKSGI